MPCSLLLDENVPHLAPALRNLGHEVATVQELGMRGKPDSNVLDYAAAQGRIVVTGDLREFPKLSEIWNKMGKAFPGIILLTSGNLNPPDAIARRLEDYIWPNPERLQNSLSWLPSR
jgi:predicted nuclease of predicted toxin-antitoxin system